MKDDGRESCFSINEKKITMSVKPHGSVAARRSRRVPRSTVSGASRADYPALHAVARRRLSSVERDQLRAAFEQPISELTLDVAFIEAARRGPDSEEAAARLVQLPKALRRALVELEAEVARILRAA